MKIKFTVLVLSALLLHAGANTVFAGQDKDKKKDHDKAGNAAERALDNKQINQAVKSLERDPKELAKFEGHLADFDQAIKADKPDKARGIHQELVKDMTREVDQADAKAKQAKAEVTQSATEVKREGKDVIQDLQQGDVKKAVGEVTDVLKDAVDKKDDKHDLQKASGRAERMNTILEKSRAVKLSFKPEDKATMDAHRADLTEFARLMQMDIAATKAELNEDRQERKEDRQETRKDKRDN